MLGSCGGEALSKRGILTLKYPIEFGVVTSWDDWERLMSHTFYNELRRAPEEHPILLTEPPLNPKANREKATQIMFETFNTPALYLCSTAVLAMWSTGKKTGIVLESGGGVTHVVPIYENHSVPHAIQRLSLGGRDVTDRLVTLLTERNEHINQQFAEEIKKEACFVSCDVEADLAVAAQSAIFEKGIEFPDGEVITVSTERFMCPEILFQPSLHHMESPGVHELIYAAGNACELEMRKDLFENIVLSGGNTCFPGIGERLHGEMTKLLSSSYEHNIEALPSRRHNTWAGGSILSSLTAFQQMWISKDEYDENGPSIVHRKCIS